MLSPGDSYVDLYSFASQWRKQGPGYKYKENIHQFRTQFFIRLHNALSFFSSPFQFCCAKHYWKVFVVVDLCLIFMSPGIKLSVQYLKEFRYVKHNAKRKIKRHMVFEFVEISTSIYISLKPACIVFCLIYKQKFAFDMRNIPSLYLSCRTTQGT